MNIVGVNVCVAVVGMARKWLCVLYWAVGRDGVVGCGVSQYVGGIDEWRWGVIMCRLCSKAVFGVESAVAVFK